MKIQKRLFECEREGLIIRGCEYRKEGDHLPIAIVCHGFMAFQDTVKQYALKLAELGYAAYTFDFCGGSVIKGKSDGKTTSMSVLTEIKDLEAVLNYTKRLIYTDSTEILLMGCSQGGFVSALLASRLQSEIKKLILFYPALCIPDDARTGKMMMAKFDPHDIPETLYCGLMKLGKRYVEDVIHLDPFEEIKHYQNDVLIVHGDKDGIVNLDYSIRAKDVYLNRNHGKVMFKVIEKGKHGFSKKHDQMAMQYIQEFVVGK